jgi:hypothetical protein
MEQDSAIRIAQAHEYYLQMCEWRMSSDSKIRIFSELVKYANNRIWRVTGITAKALSVFALHGFKRVSKMGVQRGHINSRSTVYKYLLEARIGNVDEWWNYYYSRDFTVLMTSSENISGIHSKIFEIDDEDLFVCAGYSWRHRKQEELFLNKLYKNNFD